MKDRPPVIVYATPTVAEAVRQVSLSVGLAVLSQENWLGARADANSCTDSTTSVSAVGIV